MSSKTFQTTKKQTPGMRNQEKFSKSMGNPVFAFQRVVTADVDKHISKINVSRSEFHSLVDTPPDILTISPGMITKELLIGLGVEEEKIQDGISPLLSVYMKEYIAKILLSAKGVIRRNGSTSYRIAFLQEDPVRGKISIIRVDSGESIEKKMEQQSASLHIYDSIFTALGSQNHAIESLASRNKQYGDIIRELRMLFWTGGMSSELRDVANTRLNSLKKHKSFHTDRIQRYIANMTNDHRDYFRYIHIFREILLVEEEKNGKKSELASTLYLLEEEMYFEITAWKYMYRLFLNDISKYNELLPRYLDSTKRRYQMKPFSDWQNQMKNIGIITEKNTGDYSEIFGMQARELALWQEYYESYNEIKNPEKSHERQQIKKQISQM